MLRFRPSALALTCALGGASIAVAACGSDSAQNPSYGSPPDAGFNPGPASGGDGYGSGAGAGNGTTGGGGGFDAGPTTCDEAYRTCGETFDFPFNGETSVELRGDYRPDAWAHGDPLVHVGSKWTVNVDVPYGKPVSYKFFVNGATWTPDPANPPTTNDPKNPDGNSVKTPLTCTDYKCHEPPPPPPGVFDWRDSVIYFAFVDRFVDGDPQNNCSVAGADSEGQYKGGDWAGITQKINAGYFTDLGVNTLWITVPLKNADGFAGHGVGSDSHMYSAYHGYWPTDPNALESCFGTPADLKALVDAAHAKGLKVLFDYAMVHVQIGSDVYKNHPGYFWPSTKDNHDCICGQGCDWNNDAQRCWFTDYLPHWNYTVQEARDFSVTAAVNLVKSTGADGFRLDAIKHVDGSWLTQLRSTIQTQVVAAEKIPQRFYMVGETYDFSNQGFIKSFVDPATKLDGQFDFPLRLHLVKALLLGQEGMDGLAGFLQSNEDFYGVDAVMSTFLGNHDLPRTIHLAQQPPVWSDPYADGKNLAWQNQPQLPGDAAFARLATAFGVLFTQKGAPLIYYGDEIGLPGAGDPDNRRMMQWNGYTPGQQALHDAIKKLLAIRAAHPALRRGHLTTIGTPTADTWVYSRSTPGDTVYVVASPNGKMTTAGIPSGVTTLYSTPTLAIYAK